VSDSVKSLASKAFDGVVAQIDSNGWLGNVSDGADDAGWLRYSAAPQIPLGAADQAAAQVLRDITAAPDD
jgi:hypothetical protein